MKRAISSLACIALAMVLGVAAHVHAQTPAPALLPVKLGGLRTIQFMPIQFAHQRGYFKREGLDVELITLNSGPAVISAVASGAIHVGYAAPVPVIFARAQNQPVRIFNALTMGGMSGDVEWNWLVASEKSGVRSIKDLAGKTIAMNTTGGACELQYREAMAKAGVSYDAVKKIVVPYPQMQAALQLGNADSTCIVEPFRASMRVSASVKSIDLSTGTLADRTARYPEDILFVREDWGNGNMDVLRRINRGIAAALADFKKDPMLFRRALTEDLKLSGAIVSLMNIDLVFANTQATSQAVKPLIDALIRHQMLKAPMNPDDVVLRVE